MIGIIAAVSINGVIGLKKENCLPFSYPEDMKHFRETTKDSIVVMGRNTFESIGRPLPKRENIVISSKELNIPGITCLTSLGSVKERKHPILMNDKKMPITMM